MGERLKGLDMNRKPRKWTDHEVLRAKAWRKAGHTYTDIDRWLDRPDGATAQKLNYQTDTASGHQVSAGGRPTEAALAERDRRSEAAERRDLTGMFCGDPPPGYSALDRQRAVSV